MIACSWLDCRPPTARGIRRARPPPRPTPHRRRAHQPRSSPAGRKQARHPRRCLHEHAPSRTRSLREGRLRVLLSVPVRQHGLCKHVVWRVSALHRRGGGQHRRLGRAGMPHAHLACLHAARQPLLHPARLQARRARGHAAHRRGVRRLLAGTLHSALLPWGGLHRRGIRPGRHDLHDDARGTLVSRPCGHGRGNRLGRQRHGLAHRLPRGGAHHPCELAVCGVSLRVGDCGGHRRRGLRPSA